MTKKLSIISTIIATFVLSNVCIAVVEIDNVKIRPVVQIETKVLKDEAPSYLSAG